jgi:DNA repair exonuclease SbcCD ATPase subunit
LLEENFDKEEEIEKKRSPLLEEIFDNEAEIETKKEELQKTTDILESHKQELANLKNTPKEKKNNTYRTSKKTLKKEINNKQSTIKKLNYELSNLKSQLKKRQRKFKSKVTNPLTQMKSKKRELNQELNTYEKKILPRIEKKMLNTLKSNTQILSNHQKTLYEKKDEQFNELIKDNEALNKLSQEISSRFNTYVDLLYLKKSNELPKYSEFNPEIQRIIANFMAEIEMKKGIIHPAQNTPPNHKKCLQYTETGYIYEKGPLNEGKQTILVQSETGTGTDTYVIANEDKLLYEKVDCIPPST